MDPAKMKVVELREELQARGLNPKGVKAELVKRLKEALEKETQTTIPDTSILETSTEEMDTSQNEPEEKSVAEEPPEKKKTASPVKESPKKEAKKEETAEEESHKHAEENGDDNSEQDDDDNEEEQDNSEEKADAEKTEDGGETKGEKRKRESGDQENQKKKREKSPIKEDEPEIDASKTLLSWYDSDLLLQLNKENFLSATPMNDGAMGYIWNGVRATHGISSGKICYEVKLKEALKWEDLTSKFSIPERSDNRYKKTNKDAGKKNEEAKTKAEGEKKDGEKKETKEEKMETDESKTEAAEGGAENKEEPKETPKAEDEKKEPEKKEEEEKKDEAKDGENKEEEAKKEAPKEPIPTHLFRVGFSLGNTTLQLGEHKFSYGYESTGKFVHDKTLTAYGATFGEGDVVGAFLSIDNKQVKITYTVNGAVQPVAITVPCSEFPENFVLYPHVAGRNFAFELNFGDQEEPWFPIPNELKEYKFLSKVENKVAGPSRPETRKECEVYLMIGLPASGKTHWVQEHIQNNADKQFTVIGNHSIQEKMTVDCESIRQRFAGSWKILNDKLQKTLNRITDIAALRRRHFIIDQTNLFQAAQRRKMRAFEGYQRKAVILVPEEEEQNRRLKQQQEQDGKSIPEQTIWELKAGFEIPDKVDWLEETIWPELDEEKSKEVVKKYNEDAKSKGYTKRFPRRNQQRWNDKYDNRRGGNQRYGGWGSWGRQGGGWDRRDRGPPKQGGWGDYGNRNGRQAASGGSGYGGGNRRSGGSGGGASWGQQGGWGGRQGAAAGGGGGGGGWNQRMYSGYQKWQQEGWGGYSQGQGGWGGQAGWGGQGGQVGQGGSRQNWSNYYGQYGQQGGGWPQQY